MEPYVAFSDDAILEGATPQRRSLEVQTGATIPMKTQPAPTKEPTKEADSTEVPAEVVAPTEADHTKVPTKEVESTEIPAEVVAPTEVSAKEPAAPMATISRPAEEPNISPAWHEEKGKGEVPHSDFPGWTEVMHPAQLVTPTGQTSPTLGELR